MRTLLAAALLCLACGQVSAPPGQADASRDVATTCESYCECMAATCSEPDPLGCVDGCLALEEEVRTCRVIHCGLAQNAEREENEADVILHCGHARGIGLCQAAD